MSAGAWIIAAASLVAFKLYWYLTTGRCNSKASLKGRTVIVTGANTGIGYEAAKDFAKRKAKVIMACRDIEKAQKSRLAIIIETNNTEVYIKKLDFASLSSIRAFAKDVLENEKKIHILVNNAGVAGLKNYLSEDGNQIALQVNHFGPFLLTNLLLGRLKESAPSRIVNVSAMGHRWAKIDLEDINMTKHWRSALTYCNSKLGNIITANEIARRLDGSGVTANSLHPGVVMTEIFRNLSPWIRIPIYVLIKLFYKTAEEGAQTIIHLAVSEEVENVSGKYFVDCKLAKMSEKAMDVEFAKKFWDKSEECVKLRAAEKHY